MNKKDRTGFTDEELESIKSIYNVDHIVKNDLLIDNKITLVSDSSYLWFDSYIRDYDLVKEVREAEERLRNAIVELDNKVDRNLNKENVYSDDTSFWKRIKALPNKLDWGNK